MSHWPAKGVLGGHLRLAQEAWSVETAIKAAPGQAHIDAPAVQADTGSRNANNAGWRGLQRAGVLGQAGGSRPMERPAEGPWLLAKPPPHPFGVIGTQAADKIAPS